MQTLPIRDVLPATARARIIRLGLADQPFPYLAGQAVLVGSHGREKRRPYSIATAPEDAARNHWIELLIGVDTTGSPGSHLSLDAGGLVDVEGPLGRFTFPPAPRERRFVFVAGGTGIAPLRAMLHHALQVDHDSIGLLYSARTASEFAYEAELRTLARTGAIELAQTITRDDATEGWSGARGRIDRASLGRLVHGPETLCFVCGPPALVADMPRLLAELDVTADRIRIEEWGS